MTAAFDSKLDDFRLEEATIEDLHKAIKSGKTTCEKVIERYIERVRAFNGVCSMLITEDGAPVKRGTRCRTYYSADDVPHRNGEGLNRLPDLDKYRGPPIEYGRMEATASDPSVQQQFGMIVGIPLRTSQRPSHTEYPRRTLGDMPRQLYQHPSIGPLPPARRRSASTSESAGRPRAGRGA